jgi:hypothetical protein
MAREEKVLEALKLLVEEIRRAVDRHPAGHALAGQEELVQLRLALPTELRDGNLEQPTLKALQSIQAELQRILTRKAMLQPGRVFCLRCQQSRCEHAAPTDPRTIFAGFGPTGTPRFLDFGQWLIERRDPRVDLLYEAGSALLTCTALERDLTKELLPPFRDHEGGYRVHGQVVAGWYWVPDPSGSDQALAMTFQVVSVRPRGGRRQLELNVLGVGPQGEALERLYQRLGRIPWAPSVRWAQSVLEQMEKSLQDRRHPPGSFQRRLEGLLGGLARRLEQGQRAQQRRTHHAELHHLEGERPTRMALADLARAREEHFLFDTRRQTVIVLGERGRAHAFNLEGKLVTSVRYGAGAIERRRKFGLWRPASASEIVALKTRIHPPPAS